MSINDIIDEALTLKPQERYKIIDTLISSLSVSNEDLSHLEDKITEGMESSVSLKSHKEVFQHLKSKYA